jgi:predicted  nucleic acid-binding Zn-ribbon protein
MLRAIVIGTCLAIIAVGGAAGQAQRPAATLDDLVTEVRAMRVEINRAASASIRTQLLTARMTLQELRLSTAAQQLSNVRQQIAESRIRLAPSTDQIKPAMETNSQILAPLRHSVQQEQRRTQELRNEEAELMRLVESEESRWVDFNARLDEMEQALAQGRAGR